MFNEENIRDLERRAADCWPPFKEVNLEGWRLRSAEGASRRANSVLPLADESDSPLEARIQAAETYYRRRGLSCRFQISGGVLPRELDSVLERRGYEIECRTFVMTAALSVVLENTGPRTPIDGKVRLFSSPSAAWFHVYGGGMDPGRDRGLRCQLAEGLPAPRAYAVLDSGAEPAAVGAAVLSGDWALLLCMVTRRGFRHRGLATQIINSLATWSATGPGGENRKAFLQVEADNSPAVALYQKVGFQPAHTYYYRTRHWTNSEDTLKS